MTNREERPKKPEQEALFDSMSFRLCMDGIWASIKLNREKPDRGMTIPQAEVLLAKMFPEASEIHIEEP